MRAQRLIVLIVASSQISLPSTTTNPIVPFMSDWINSTFRILVLWAFLVNSAVMGAHDMPQDAILPTAHQMHMAHAVPHGDIPGHSLPDPVCKQHCFGMATPESDVVLGHDPAPRLEAPVVEQAQVAGLRLALPEPPPKTAV